MKRTALYLLLTILISFNNTSLSAEFPWFNVQGFEGWVEYTTNVSADRRINVLPKLYGPSGTGEFGGASVDASKLISVRTNGDIVLKYLILSAPSRLPFNFRQEVSRSVMQNGFRPTGFNENGLNEYQIIFPKITNIVAKIIVDGEVIREESFGSTFVAAEHTGEFLFRQNDNNYSAIYNGDFKITLDFQFPYETFSSMSLKINQATLTNIKVDVFRQVIRKAKSSGSKMWFIDTRKETIKTIEKERISTSANSSFSSNIDIILRDPDEIILKQMESFLGYQKISKDDLLLRHKELQTAAVLNGNSKLGELSANYIKALNNNDETAQIDILASLAALEKGDILTFFASGVSFKESSSSTSYTYTASIETEITMEQSEFYTTSVIKTLNYNYHAQITEFPYLLMAIQNAEDKRIVEVFGSPMPSKEQVNAALLNAVQTNNLTNMKLALLKGGDPNLREHADYNTLLNICIQSNRNLLVAELLNKGANPNLKNRHGESAFTLIESSNSEEIRSLVLSYKDRSGTTNFKITLSPNFAISNVSLNLNGNVTGYVPKYSETGVWTVDGVKEYPSTYDMNAIVTIWTKVSPEMNNQFIHNNFLLAGFTAVYSQSGYTYTKQVPLYDRVKIINNGSNTYNYDLIFNPTNYSITEATGKNNNFTTSIQQSSLDGMMYNFER